VIIFGSVRFLSKKVIKPKLLFFWKKNQNRTETGSNRPVSVRFGFFRAKTGSNRFGSVFSGSGSVFFGLARFFSGFLSVSVRFFWFFVYKTEPAGFFKNLIGLIGFFFGSVFSVIFFSGFLGLIGFPVFLLTPSNFLWFGTRYLSLSLSSSSSFPRLTFQIFITLQFIYFSDLVFIFQSIFFLFELF